MYLIFTLNDLAQTFKTTKTVYEFVLADSFIGVIYTVGRHTAVLKCWINISLNFYYRLLPGDDKKISDMSITTADECGSLWQNCRVRTA